MLRAGFTSEISQTMRAITPAFLMFVSAVCLLSGCGGGTVKGVQLDKTLAHKGGIFNLSQVSNIAGKVEARTTSAGEWTDVSGMKEKDIEAWMKGKSGIEARSYIQFDDFQLPLQSATISKAGQIKDMQDYARKRMNDVNNFMKNNNKQLDARNW